MSRLRGEIYSLAIRASQAAAMLGISESMLRQLVIEGKVHKPYRIRKNVVLFDAAKLATDWDRIKDEAEASILAAGANEIEEGPNPWDLAYPVSCQSCCRVDPRTAVERFASRC